MSTAFLDISAALDNHLNGMTGLPSVAWENYPFTPVVGTLWIRPTNLQGETFAETENDITSGVYQIDVFAEAGQGKNEAVTMADTIADRFAIDTEMTYNGVMVRVSSCSRTVANNNSDGWYHLMILVNYYSYTTRRA